MSKVFIDTNVLVYAFDRADQVKQNASIQLLQSLGEDPNDRGVISTQVLSEFFVAATKKLKMASLEVKSHIQKLQNFEVVQVTPVLIERAIDCHLLQQISFWDALIVVAAENARCEKVWTEDLNNGQLIRGVRIANPFMTGSQSG
jgi:predicted nucleic acid-binding protein